MSRATPAEASSPPPGDARPSMPAPASDVLERSWRAFASPALLLALTLVVGVGLALDAWGLPSPDTLARLDTSAAGRPWLRGLYDLFELRAPFRSTWFSLGLVALGLVTLASALERLPGPILSLVRPPVSLDDAAIRSLPNHQLAKQDGLTIEAVSQSISTRGYSVATHVHDGVTSLLGESGGWARVFGVVAVHVGLLAVVAGAFANRYGGFDGTMELRSGGPGSAFLDERQHDGLVIPRPLGGFGLRCDAFELDRSQGTPRPLRSALSVLDGAGEVILKQRLDADRTTLSWGGLTFEQAGLRELQDQSIGKVELVDNTTGEKKVVEGAPSAPFFLGDGTLRYSIVDFQQAFGELGPAIQVLREEGPLPSSPGFDAAKVKRSTFWVFKNYPGFDEKYRGDRFGLRFGALEPLYLSVLRVRYAPGEPVVLVGVVLVLVGLLLSSLTTRRRLWVRFSEAEVLFGGLADSKAELFRATFDAWVADVTARRESKESAANPATGAAS